MARRTSRRFVAVEGQISLFAMDDPSIYEAPAEKQIDDVDAQQRLALDFGAQQESYVSQTGGDKAPARMIPRRKRMSVLKNPYRGVRGLRYSFMEQKAPEDLARMDAAGETEEYLKAVERNYLTRLAELQDSCMESCGRHRSSRRLRWPSAGTTTTFAGPTAPGRWPRRSPSTRRCSRSSHPP